MKNFPALAVRGSAWPGKLFEDFGPREGPKRLGTATLGCVSADQTPANDEGNAGSRRGTAAGDAVEVRRSARRRRTVSAYRQGDRTVVLIPAQMSTREEERWVRAMLARLDSRERRSKPGEAELADRAKGLSDRYLNGRAVPLSVRWVTNQGARWGSCTPVDASIRLSDRLRGMPDFVIDYVLLHELAHLIEPNHGPGFWRLLEPFPKLERARGFLDGFAAAASAGQPPRADGEGPVPGDADGAYDSDICDEPECGDSGA
jgi:predicted metal-dependent hydrolase